MLLHSGHVFKGYYNATYAFTAIHLSDWVSSMGSEEGGINGTLLPLTHCSISLVSRLSNFIIQILKNKTSQVQNKVTLTDSEELRPPRRPPTICVTSFV